MPEDAPDASAELRIDGAAREAFVGARRINARLSRKEFDLLLALYERRDRVVTREELGDAVWGAPSRDATPQYDDHMLHALVHRVRRKLDRAGVDLSRYLTAVPGHGYRLSAIPSPGDNGPSGSLPDVADDGEERPFWSRLGVAAGLWAAVAVVVVGLAVVAFIVALDGRGSDNSLSVAVPASPTPRASPTASPRLLPSRTATVAPSATGPLPTPTATSGQPEATSDSSTPTPTPTPAETSTPPSPVVTPCAAEMIEPLPGSTLAGSTVTFRWTAGCTTTKHDLWVGCSPGADDFYNADDHYFTEATVTGLPLDGGPVSVFLFSGDGTEEGFFARRLTYTAATAPGGGTAVSVPGTSSWVDTGIDIGPDQTVDIDSCGQTGINSTGQPRFQPDGNANCPGVWRYGFPLPEAACWSLIGRIGGGEPFYVGKSLQLVGHQVGRLYLEINDDNPTDNTDAFRATVRLTP